MVYVAAEGFLNGLFAGLFWPLLGVFADIFVPLFTVLLLWRFNNAWLHKVISRPSPKTWFARVGEQSRSRSVLQAIVLWAFCRSISAFVPQILFFIFVLSKFTKDGDEIHFADDASPRDTALEAIGIYALGLLLLLLLVVPATIVLVRVQASMLPDTDEPIVPFDKTFGGSVASESVNGGGKLTLRDAWQSFAWPARIRLLKIYAKCFILQVLFGMFTTFVVITLCVIASLPLNNGLLALVARINSLPPQLAPARALA
jgi:hypothetical protein